MISLSPEQARVIGVMLEKETTTPEQYPLSINGLANGCNQKSNREPVMSLSESDIQNIVDELVQMNQLMVDHKASGRVNKYFHRFCNTEFGSLQLTLQQRAIICVLLLRGPQTPGELRTRTNRLADFSDVSEVEAALTALQDLNGNVLVKKLAREPGKRESRYVQLFSDEEYIQAHEEPNAATEGVLSTSESQLLSERIIALEEQVASLTEKLTQLSAQLDD
ncbi:YceH family protein [Litorilituus lipolyticus]|uniref:DUF480 domain-containing protein n=1 Tax=Litorilituus lipolyticus TaxID=2491017 RepID=A0A502L064_9GAMM|nr:DUF480 domain-containing protein [Litorilituus lipolyticus]TPH15651.1 DUF480 domain-containing protein [Litorilituus lipolyticus]